MAEYNVPEWVNVEPYSIQQTRKGDVLYTEFKNDNNRKCIIYFAGRNAFFMYGNMLRAYPEYDVVCIDHKTYGFNKEPGFHKKHDGDSYNNNYVKLANTLGDEIDDYIDDHKGKYDEFILMGFSTGAFVIMNILNYHTFKYVNKIKRVVFISPLVKFYPTIKNCYAYPLSKLVNVISYLGIGVKFTFKTSKDKEYNDVIKTCGAIGYNVNSSYLTTTTTKHNTMFAYIVNNSKWTKEDINHNGIPIYVAMPSISSPSTPGLAKHYNHDCVLDVGTTFEELLQYIPPSNIKTFISGHDMLLLPIREGKKSYLDVLKYLLDR